MQFIRSIAIALLCIATATFPGCKTGPASLGDPGYGMDQVDSYAQLSLITLVDVLRSTRVVQLKVDQFLADPKPRTLAGAQQAWMVSRISFSQAEALFQVNDTQGSQAAAVRRIAGWPIQPQAIERFIKSAALAAGAVDAGGAGGQGDDAGVLDEAAEKAALIKLKSELMPVGPEQPQAVLTGYHALEYLLFGMDENPLGPGVRNPADYEAKNAVNQRRRLYLRAATALLVDDAKRLADGWAPDQPNEAGQFKLQHGKVSVAQIVGGLIRFNDSVLNDRFTAALSQPDDRGERSRFSDNTNRDLLNNVQGILNVYHARYRGFGGKSVGDLVAAKDPVLHAKLDAQLRRTIEMLKRFAYPFDRTINAPEGSQRAAQAKAITLSLEAQGESLKQLPKLLELPTP